MKIRHTFALALIVAAAVLGVACLKGVALAQGDPFNPYSFSTYVGDFAPRYMRDYNPFDPLNKYQPDNPLNPINRFSPDNPFNPINRFDPENPANPINRLNPDNPFNPINRLNPDNPLNPINRYNPDVPFAPLDW
jgi:hypothetical protein